VNRFAAWLAQTSVSLTIQNHEWVIPTIQSVHIVAIGVVLGSVFMIALRILGWAGGDQTLPQTTARFGPWLSWALVLLAVTGAVMIVGEPVRELLAFSFWVKMALVAAGTAAALLFKRALHRREGQSEAAFASEPRLKAMAVVTLLIWAGAVVFGRLIAYDHIWGSWSKALKG
jgi:hypothetical protein